MSSIIDVRKKAIIAFVVISRIFLIAAVTIFPNLRSAITHDSQLEMVLVATHKALGNIKEDVHFYGAANAADSLDELQDKLEEVIQCLNS